MARFTIELRDVVERHNIFDFKYPFYDENKRAEFEQKFIRHFYFREICHPSIDRFKLYLEDKMNTVFPYYNELFNSANIEYSILDNYSLTEEYTSTRETEGKTSGISSSVGQTFGNQETESNHKQFVDGKGNVATSSSDNDKEMTHATTNSNETTDKSRNDSASGDRESVRKFLDTPQGLTNLNDSKYLTTLNHDTENTSQSSEGSETGSITNNTEVNTSRDVERHSSGKQTSENKQTTDDNIVGTVKDEQKSTHDNNTRTYTDGKQTETHTLKRKGNIGVDTDSDMIEKHIRLQKTLRSIEQLFFNECEDLFMLVY